MKITKRKIKEANSETNKTSELQKEVSEVSNAVVDVLSESDIKASEVNAVTTDVGTIEAEVVVPDDGTTDEIAVEDVAAELEDKLDTAVDVQVETSEDGKEHTLLVTVASETAAVEESADETKSENKSESKKSEVKESADETVSEKEKDAMKAASELTDADLKDMKEMIKVYRTRKNEQVKLNRKKIAESLKARNSARKSLRNKVSK